MGKESRWFKCCGEWLITTVTEGEIEGTYLPDIWRTAWIDDMRRSTEGGLPAARRTLLTGYYT